MFTFEPQGYGLVCGELLAEMPLCELGPGVPNKRQRDRLAALSPDSLAGNRRVRDRQMAECCISGLWLLYDYLDESHRLSQEIATKSGSYWHGIMHRREPDFENAKYWFRQVGRHAIADELCHAVQSLIAESSELRAEAIGSAQYLTSQNSWDAFRFVDLCEAAYRGQSATESLCRRIAQLEWQLLFNHCFQAAFVV